MFKEAFVGVLALAVFYLLCKFVQKKKPRLLSVLLFSFLFLSCAANLAYDAAVVFPDFYMDTVNGPFRYGTLSGNLFAYSDEFMYQDEILFPILKDRSVFLDESADYYAKFFSLYANSCERMPVEASVRKRILSSREAFSFSHPFTCIGIMDYVTTFTPQALQADLDEEIYPMLYIDKASLKEQDQLAVVMMEDYTLYLMGMEQYRLYAGGVS